MENKSKCYHTTTQAWQRRTHPFSLSLAHVPATWWVASHPADCAWSDHYAKKAWALTRSQGFYGKLNFSTHRRLQWIWERKREGWTNVKSLLMTGYSFFYHPPISLQLFLICFLPPLLMQPQKNCPNKVCSWSVLLCTTSLKWKELVLVQKFWGLGDVMSVLPR